MKNEFVFTREAPMLGSLSAFVTLPTGFAPGDEKPPVIVFLHGAGEAGDGSPEELPLVHRHGIPKYFGADADYQGLRAITVSPQCPKGFIWDQITLQLKDFLDSAVAVYGGDPTRVSVTGISMGGFGTWNLLTTYPEAFYRAAPICGGGVPWRVKETLRGKPIRVYHSIDDPSVPYECSVLMAKRARAAGAEIEFTTYCAEGHGCWDRAYEEGDLIKWLAGAKRNL